ncbi:MAG: hypothetical protein VKL42_00920 [Snowella sp.]|nr:hypothetical protein [Snowella sp.]
MLKPAISSHLLLRSPDFATETTTLGVFYEWVFAILVKLPFVIIPLAYHERENSLVGREFCLTMKWWW